MNKQQLAAKIWESANKMRSKIAADGYKDYILGFIFYKYLSEKQIEYFYKMEMDADEIKECTEADSELVKDSQDSIGYFIAYENLFSTWISMRSDFKVSNVHDALSSFSRLIGAGHKKVFNGIFNTLETGLSKLGDNAASQTKAIRDLIYLIDDIPMDGKQDYDVLGFIYEYLISNFAASAGKKAGEFYTPHEVSLLMSEIVANHLKDRKNITIYDPTSGSGSLLINIGKSASKYIGTENNIRYYAQELIESTYNLTRMNLVMRGIIPANIITRNGDTLEDDWPYFDEKDPQNSYEPLYVDSVVSNPPYSQNWNPEGKETDDRFVYGVAPKSKADYAFLLHDLYHLKSDGIMTIVLPHGVLFRGGEEGGIRKNLIENNRIDAIIGLPANIFFGTGIPTIIMVLKKEKSSSDVLIVDASKGFEKAGTSNKLRASDIKKIVDVVIGRKTVDKYSRLVSREEIRANDYNLNIPRYVDSSEDNEHWDIYSLMFGGIPDEELDGLKDYWEAFPSLREALFIHDYTAHSKLHVSDIKEAVYDNGDVRAFKDISKESFDSFDSYLYRHLIDDMDNINISMAEDMISEEIFDRLKDIPLVDKYDAYQVLDDAWLRISQDLEVIRTEGRNSITKVVPNLVSKKKDVETQDGWTGLILPFELVQKELLGEQLDALEKSQSRLYEIDSELSEILESFTEDEKESNKSSEDDIQLLNEDCTAFVAPVLGRKAKEYSKGRAEEDSFEYKVLKANKLNDEAKSVKATIKRQSADLQNITKDRIEALTEEEALKLLEKKWIVPIMDKLHSLFDGVISTFISKLEVLVKKYSSTFSDITEEIEKTEKELVSMINELTGNEYDMKGLEEFKKLIEG